MSDGQRNHDLLNLTTKVVSAYLGANSLPASDIPGVITSVYQTLNDVGAGPSQEAIPSSPPAVSVKKSIKPDAIICLDCGKSFKMMRRHLGTDHGMSAAEYRDKWGLPADYPLVAPNYAAARSERSAKEQVNLSPSSPVQFVVVHDLTCC